MQANITAPGEAMGKTMTHRVDDASNSMHHAIDRASAAAGPAIDGLAAGAHQATNRMAATANQAATRLHSANEQLQAAQSRLAQRSRNYVGQKPLTALSIAAAAGFLLGMALWLTQETPDRH